MWQVIINDNDTCMCVRACVRACTHTCVFACACDCVCVCDCVRVCDCVCVRGCVRMCYLSKVDIEIILSGTMNSRGNKENKNIKKKNFPHTNVCSFKSKYATVCSLQVEVCYCVFPSSRSMLLYVPFKSK